MPRRQKKVKPGVVSKPQAVDTSEKDKRLEFFLLLVLLAVGIYQSVIFYGYQPAPSPDFFDFVETGEHLASFELPPSMKRAPLISFLPVVIGKLIGTNTQQLQGFWLLNSFLHPFNLVLMYLVGKRLIGVSAAIFVLLMTFNPYYMEMLPAALAETTMIFFVLLTFYLRFRNSNLCYLAASLGSLVRYEVAVLIPIIFILDIIVAKSKRQRLFTFLYAALAAAPLAVWLLVTYLTWEPGGTKHYVGHFGHGTVFAKFIKLIWQTTFRNLLFVTDQDMNLSLQTFTQITAIAGLLLAAIDTIVKKNINTMLLFAFFITYCMIHCMRAATMERYTIPVMWIVLLLCWYGFYCLIFTVRSVFNNKIASGPLRHIVMIVLPAMLTILSVFWIFKLAPFIKNLDKLCQVTWPMLNTAIVLILLFVIAHIVTHRTKRLSSSIGLVAIVATMSVCCLFSFASYIRNGQQNVEKKLIAEWYNDNAKPGEKMVVSYNVELVRYFIEGDKENVIGIGSKARQTPEAFLEHCKDRDVTYIAWIYGWRNIQNASNDIMTKVLRLTNAKQLYKPASTDQLIFVKQIFIDNQHFVNIFKLRERPEGGR